MELDSLLSPYRGYKPSVQELVAAAVRRTRSRQWADVGDAAANDAGLESLGRGIKPPTPDRRELDEFVRALTA